MLALKFASRTFAYKRLAQGLIRALSTFSSCMRDYSQTVIKAEKCAQYVDNIRTPANTVTQLIQNIRAVFECTREAELNLMIEKCNFKVTEVKLFLTTAQRVAPQDHKIQKMLANVRFPKSKKLVQTYIGFVNYYRNYIRRLSEKLFGSYKLLKADKQTKITEELLDNYKAIYAALAEACGLALKIVKHPIAGRQYVLMTNVSFRTSGYALMEEENVEKRLIFKQKTFAPVASDQKCSHRQSLKCPSITKNFWRSTTDFYNIVILCGKRLYQRLY